MRQQKYRVLIAQIKHRDAATAFTFGRTQLPFNQLSVAPQHGARLSAYLWSPSCPFTIADYKPAHAKRGHQVKLLQPQTGVATVINHR